MPSIVIGTMVVHGLCECGIIGRRECERACGIPASAPPATTSGPAPGINDWLEGTMKTVWLEQYCKRWPGETDLSDGKPCLKRRSVHDNLEDGA